MSRMIAEKKATFDPAFVDQVFKTFSWQLEGKGDDLCGSEPGGARGMDDPGSGADPGDAESGRSDGETLSSWRETGEVQRDPKARAVIDAGAARGYQLKGDEWQGVVLIGSHVFKDGEKEKKYVAPFTEFVLAEAILRGAKMKNIHSMSPLIASLEGAMERNATTPSLKSAQEVLQLTAAITRLLERGRGI